MAEADANWSVERNVSPNLGFGPATRSGTGTILLVEDEKFVREVTQQVLESAGYTVAASSNAVDAHALRRNLGGLDLLLTDVVLPGEDGRVLAASLRSLQPSLRVLFMTGYPLRQAELQAAQPAEACLAKPFSSAALLEKVRNVLHAETGTQPASSATRACAIAWPS